MSSSSQPNLLVPMNVDAMAVGASDGRKWILHAPDFTAMQNGRFLGYQQYAGSMWDPSPSPYQSGVHLRWALPDGMTQGQLIDSPDPEFPRVPNRWFILRLAADPAGTPPQPRAWVVESDYIADAPATGRESQWPIIPSTPQAPADYKYVRYVGRQIDLAQWPTTSGKYLGDVGQKLTAVGYGHAAFAAYYPLSRGAFGFYDDLSDLCSSGPIRR